MALRDIKRRIRSVKNTEKITKTMKMVSAAKLKKAQDEVQRSRAFSLGLEKMVARLSKRVQDASQIHPLLEQTQNPKRIEILVLTSDRGLCGAFNGNVFRKALALFKEKQKSCETVLVSTLGKKGFDSFRRENIPIRTNYTGILDSPTYFKARQIAEEVCNSYITHDLDAVYLVYNEFQSAMTQATVVKQMLPIVPDDEPSSLEAEFDYEPQAEALLNDLLPRYFATELFQAFLESVASEHGARMTAMDNATRNAKDMIGSLTLQYNRERQASITKELLEIIGGAEALAA